MHDAVADGAGDPQDLHRGDPAVHVPPDQELLGDDRANGIAQPVARELPLLFREDGEQVVKGAHGRRSEHAGDDELAELGGAQGDLGGLAIAHLADHDDVGVLAQGCAKP